MLLPAEPGKVVSWAMLQHHSADLRARDCRGGGRRCLLGTVTAGVWMDNQELQRLARATLDADLTLAIGDVPVASTIGRLTAEDRVPAANGIRRGQLAGRQVVMSTEPLTSGVGEQARLLVSRLRASAPAARSESWARAFERMRVELGEYLTALRSSRDELARSMNRLGETLSSTHDLPKLLAASATSTPSPATAARSSCSSCPRPTWRAAWPWPRSCAWPPTAPRSALMATTAGSG
jgi:hypothetical protein